MKNYKALSYVASVLPRSVGGIILNLPSDVADKLQEIRLRVSRPVLLRCRDSSFYLNFCGITRSPDSALALTHAEMADTFARICDYSVYSKQNELVNGFVTLKGGCRAGICGTAVYDSGKITNIRDISSVNLRIASERKGCSDELFEKVDFSRGVLLCGEPCSGKTTVLRDIARRLSLNRNVVLVDTRFELSAAVSGVPQLDVGMSDVLSGYSRKNGFEHALRCLSPEYIICDEIADEDDLSSLVSAGAGGAVVIASAHCRDEAEFIKRDILRKVLKINAFGTVVFMKDRNHAGELMKVVKTDEFCC